MLDLRQAFNTISDVIENRPPPLREFDQIYMKTGDMVIQAEFIARKFNGKRLVFIGDGDSISLSVIHLSQKKIFDYGPHEILVLDFDERIVNSINKFAAQNGLSNLISAQLYNVVDSLPKKYFSKFDGFYTNPPWGASNGGESVNIFINRGFEATNKNSMGVIVIADDSELLWPKEVLYNVQKNAIKNGYYVSEMIPELHNYHLDDAPDLKSCSLIVSRLFPKLDIVESRPIEKELLENFYGKNDNLRIRYIRDKNMIAPNTAFPGSYEMEGFNSES